MAHQTCMRGSGKPVLKSLAIPVAVAAALSAALIGLLVHLERSEAIRTGQHFETGPDGPSRSGRNGSPAGTSPRTELPLSSTPRAPADQRQTSAGGVDITRRLAPPSRFGRGGPPVHSRRPRVTIPGVTPAAAGGSRNHGDPERSSDPVRDDPDTETEGDAETDVAGVCGTIRLDRPDNPDRVLPGVYVALITGAADPSGRSRFVTRSDDLGAYAFSGIPAGPLRVEIPRTGTAPGDDGDAVFFAQPYFDPVVRTGVAEPGMFLTIDLDIRASAHLAGVVVDSLANTPVAGAEVRIWRQDRFLPSIPPPPDGLTRTD